MGQIRTQRPGPMTSDTPGEKARRFASSLEGGAGAVICCRGCGSARVDHVALDRVRCSECDREGIIDPGFALLRRRWLIDDLADALMQRARAAEGRP